MFVYIITNKTKTYSNSDFFKVIKLCSEVNAKFLKYLDFCYPKLS